jgi:hypothetical protein
VFDPDLDLPRQQPRSLTEQEIGQAQRLIINPMLGMLGWLLGVMTINYALRWHEPGLCWIALLMFMISICLIQFHCLDCGITGWFVTGRRHACPPVVRRAQEGVRPRFGIGARNQIRAWVWSFGFVALVYLMFLLARH